MRIASLVITCCVAAVAWASVEASARRALAADARAVDPGPAGPGLEAAQRAVAEARTLVQFHLAEHGDLRALDKAEQVLSSVDLRDWPVSRAEGDALRAEIAQMRASTIDTFFGRFPLARLLIGADSTTAPSVTITTLPDAARGTALSAAFKQAMEWLPGANLHAVVLVPGDPFDEQTRSVVGQVVDVVAPAAMAATPNVTFIPGIDRSALTVPAWDAPDATFVDCCRQIVEKVSHDGRAMNLCIVLVRAMNPEPTDYAWYQVQWRVFYAADIESALAKENPTSLVSAKEYVGSGLAIDRSRYAPASIATTAVLLVVALGLYAALSFASSRPPTEWHEWFVPPLAGFAIGYVLPGLIAPVFDHLAPGPGMPAERVVWWPALAGGLMLLAPAVAFNLGVRSLTGLVGPLRCDGRWGLAFMATGLGVAAFFAHTAWLAIGGDALRLVPALAVGAAAILYMFGRALDSADRYPTSLALLATVLALALGIAAMAGAEPWLWSVGLCALAVELFVWSRGIVGNSAKAHDAAPAVDNSSASAPPATLAALEERARSPDFQPSPSYAEARSFLELQPFGRTVWLALHGPSGSGKSAVATQLIADVRRRFPDARVLSASCQRDSSPYQALHDALDEILDSATLPTASQTSSGLDSVLQELVGLFVPYWSLLSGLGGNSTGSTVAAGEFYSAVASTLKRLARRQTVILYLDNLQWLDEGSAAVLRHLHERLPSGGDVRLIVLLCARDESAFRNSGIAECLLHVPPPSRSQQLAILKGSLGFEPASAERIVDALGVLGEEPGGLFWLFQAVSEMAAAELFEATPQGFAFRAGAKPKLPVPAELRTALVEKLRASGEHQLILESAALLGEVFSVNTLSVALNLDRLELLQRLRSLEQSAHIVSDLPDDEDRYAFSSAFMFETVRDELGISSTAAHRPSKFVQELHARVAVAIEASGDEESVYALARHWSTAGARHAAKSFMACRKASQQARDVFAFDESRRWLMLAEQAACTLGEPFDAAIEQVRIDCDESHVRGRDRSATADRAWLLVSERSDVPHDVLVAAARSCYDAYRDTGLAAWNDCAVSVARRIIDVSADALEKAAGYHLLGVSLPIASAVERLAALRQGLSLVEAASSNDPVSASLEARLLGSLGEALSYGETADRTAAREYFERSLDVRVSRNLGDLPGQARAHGGLGRLALGDDPPDYDRARKHFVEDLQISETIDDSAGISMSHCSLGRCDRAAGDMTEAARHYAAAFETARSVKDQYFAMIGKLELAIDTKRADETQQLGRELLEMSQRDALPVSCAEELLRVLFTDGSVAESDWAKSLIATLSSKEVAA